MAKKADGKLFLLQRYDNGDFCLYHWTPFLAKKGYKTLTAEEAIPYQKLLKVGKANMSYVENKKMKAELESARVEGEVFDEESTNAIVEDVVSNQVVKEDDTIEDPHDLIVTQDDILEQELAFVKSLTHKSSLERHMLEKYQCEVPVGRLASMKSLANSMLTDLSHSNRLYLVAGEIKL